MPRLIVVSAAIAAITAALIPPQWLSVKLGLRSRRLIPVVYHRMLCALLGVRIRVVGERARADRLLIASNHVSWLDISVLVTLAPFVFVAKREVAGWPLFGLLARLNRSVFVERERRSKTAHVNREIAARLAEGDPVVLFAEGTSSDGNRVLPFRSSLIGAAQAALAYAPSEETTGARRFGLSVRADAQPTCQDPSDVRQAGCFARSPLAGEEWQGGYASELSACGPPLSLSLPRQGGGKPYSNTTPRSDGSDCPILIQPLSIAYLGLDGLPMGRQHRPYVAWYGAMDLLPHLAEIIQRGAIDVVVTWGEPVSIDRTTDRKAITRALETEVRRLTGRALRGVWSESPEPEGS